MLTLSVLELAQLIRMPSLDVRMDCKVCDLLFHDGYNEFCNCHFTKISFRYQPKNQAYCWISLKRCVAFQRNYWIAIDISVNRFVRLILNKHKVKAGSWKLIIRKIYFIQLFSILWTIIWNSIWFDNSFIMFLCFSN